MSNNYVHTIYTHPLITVQDINNYKLVVATGDIKAGELLMLEHVFAAKNQLCMTAIAHNEYLYDDYHPRTNKFKETDSDTRSSESVQKYYKNCFGLGKEKGFLTDLITKMNHSCNPNSSHHSDTYFLHGTDVIFMSAYSVRNIKAGEEITHCYNTRLHNENFFGFVCQCDTTQEQRDKIFQIILNIVAYYAKQDKQKIDELVANYIESDIGEKILLYHYLLNNGIIMNHDQISYIIDPEGLEFVRNTVSKHMPIENESIKLNDSAIIQIFSRIIGKMINKNKSVTESKTESSEINTSNLLVSDPNQNNN
jgi:hypothetical protein